MPSTRAALVQASRDAGVVYGTPISIPCGLSEAEIDRLFQLIIEMKALDRILGQSTEKEE